MFGVFSAGERLYSFPVFTVDFCNCLTEELEHFEASDCPRGRPNTMNNYGVCMIFFFSFLFYVI